MICLLYNDVLCLALGVKMEMIYDIHACINLNRARMEAADSGRGRKPTRLHSRFKAQI